MVTADERAAYEDFGHAAVPRQLHEIVLDLIAVVSRLQVHWYAAARAMRAAALVPRLGLGRGRGCKRCRVGARGGHGSVCVESERETGAAGGGGGGETH